MSFSNDVVLSVRRLRKDVGFTPLAIAFPMTPDIRVLAATFMFCLFATVVSGLGPAMKMSKLEVFPQLKEQAGEAGAISHGRGRFWLLAPRNALVVLQTGLSLALLATGGLFVRGSLTAADSDPGFRVDSGLLFELDPSLAGYDTARSRQLYASVLDRVRALPGVETASLASTVPKTTMSPRWCAPRSTASSWASLPKSRSGWTADSLAGRPSDATS